MGLPGADAGSGRAGYSYPQMLDEMPVPARLDLGAGLLPGVNATAVEARASSVR
eukprot:CAMPEP_0118812564 /NCGR_PEP_ID=MMETSP1162-20130426/2380_1 /TAXON_ID=33656 /ORGANISM="Phaeocystis Sp, Strain CCMP2710" /LENGTH=53 /DNA_ID=CAMNT_0006742295 /DNA_START=375 /DNA_END=539 /DNA_ORIENTATION=+